MCEFHRTGRRTFLTDLGRGALAISVFTPILGACSSASRESEQPATTARPDATSVSSTAPSTAAPTTGAPVESTAAASPTAPEVASSTPPNDAGVPITYRRVNLGFVSAYLLVRGNEAAVIDTGIAGSAAAIGKALDAASLDWAAVRHVLLTHHHPDHAGSIGDVLTAAVNATAYAGEADVASITAPRTVSSLADGDEVFGLQIVGTPGHTAGHIAIYDPLGKVLVAGDAINNVDGLGSESAVQQRHGGCHRVGQGARQHLARDHLLRPRRPDRGRRRAAADASGRQLVSRVAAGTRDLASRTGLGRRTNRRQRLPRSPFQPSGAGLGVT